jgi:hypothetical protein
VLSCEGGAGFGYVLIGEKLEVSAGSGGVATDKHDLHSAPVGAKTLVGAKRRISSCNSQTWNDQDEVSSAVDLLEVCHAFRSQPLEPRIARLSCKYSSGSFTPGGASFAVGHPGPQFDCASASATPISGMPLSAAVKNTAKNNELRKLFGIMMSAV